MSKDAECIREEENESQVWGRRNGISGEISIRTSTLIMLWAVKI